jgi:hypothetical protein
MTLLLGRPVQHPNVQAWEADDLAAVLHGGQLFDSTFRFCPKPRRYSNLISVSLIDYGAHFGNIQYASRAGDPMIYGVRLSKARQT